ncbi:MAG: choice-of-anchor tandem repeat GloVer-containing protein [Candidatus Sulfotelmatobacter sp.]
MSSQIFRGQGRHASLLLQKTKISPASAALKMICALCLICAAFTAAQAQVTILASFNGTDGGSPQNSLVEGSDGNFYGTVQQVTGTENFAGLIYRVTPAGVLSTFYNFCSQTSCADGTMPDAALTLGSDGDLYGTTTQFGAHDGGTIFKITTAGVLTTLYNFCVLKNCPDGAAPRAGLVLASDGNFYGTTQGGGKYVNGTIFRISPSGAFHSLYSFCALTNCPDGAAPGAALVQGNNGELYGSTYEGGTVDCPFFGSFGCGTIFKITLSGNLTTLYSIGTDAGLLTTPLTLARNGNFYGASENGGTCGTNGCGTVFEVTPAGAYSTLYSFCTLEFCADGDLPKAGLVQATNGILYGSTSNGGTVGGTVFGISTSGTLNTIYDFAGFAHGSMPEASMIQATDGNLYGLVNEGGADEEGAIFRVATGLAPFVQTVPPAGSASAQVLILGNNLSTANAVSFNGTAATFTVVSDTQIDATVPSAASSGLVTVTTSSGTLSSNVVFRIVP